METRDLYEELYQALMANDEPRARAILAAGADINARDHDGLTFVMMFAKGENERPDSINFFLEHGADVNLRSPEGKTALGYAYDTLARCRRGASTRMNEDWILDMLGRLKAHGAEL